MKGRNLLDLGSKIWARFKDINKWKMRLNFF